MHTNVEKKLKLINSLLEQCEDGIQRQQTIDLTADANRQQGANGGNFNGNSRTRDKAIEPNIPYARTEWRMEEDIRLENVKQGTYCQTLQDDRHPKYNFNAKNRGLDVHVGYNICLQPHKGQPTTATIFGVSDTGNQLYISWDAIQDIYCAIHICENDTTDN
ncbi:MAG: hypothetical protein EZS28_005966 [Streblomastix strix]|uniref:Uncharacterized protein n=1 Tax=Streblomastix strix TaxID=222440 RepID=A0A5J4WU72_9EUKA|nr:MAG: hypothetical protein EZS28_005966 [Streblomastix strix]